MPTYYVNEAVFTLPERRFVDRTIHRLEAPLSGEDPLRVAIRRVPIEEGKSLRQMVDQELATTTAEVKSFAVLDETEVTVAGAPAILLRARWRTAEEVHYQLQAHLAYGETWIGIVVTAPIAEREACDETFDRVVHSLEWQRGSGRGHPQIMPSYYANEAAFDLPERPFVDKTVHALEVDLPDDKTLAVFVHRRPIEAGQSLRALVDEHVTLNQTRLHAFTVLDEAEALVGGLPAVVLRTRWRHERATFYQLQAHVPLGDVLMVFAVTGPDTERPAGDETFASILHTVTWRAS